MTILLGFISLFCFIYYLIIIFYAGFQASFSLFWLIAGVITLCWSLLVRLAAGRPQALDLPLWLKVASITTISALFLVFIVVELFIGTNMLSDTDEELDYVIVLGSKVHGDTISTSLKYRLDKAIEYYQEHPDTIIIVAGGQGRGENITEAEAMRKYLVANGIPRVNIRQEVRSANTEENIRFSRFFTKGSNVVGIITSDFHVFRAKEIAYQQGFGYVVGIPAKSDNILKLNFMVREAFAVLKDKFMGNI